MGLSVWNQVDNKKYFSISSIDKRVMKEYGINIPVSKLKEIVRKTPPHAQITTGSMNAMGERRLTNIYRYEDFVNLA